MAKIANMTEKERVAYEDKKRLTEAYTHNQSSHEHTSKDTFGHSYEGRNAAGKVEAVVHATEFLLPDQGKNE